MSNKHYISLPYIYPVCPLNIDHARMFIIADIIARHSRSKGKKVYFPVASHYSGNTAHKISAIFKKIYYSDKKKAGVKKHKVLNLYENIYSTPDYILKNFINPLYILDYYSQEVLWELKSLSVSCDYKYFYTTKSKEFNTFINSIISLYGKNNLLINNKEGKLALDYNNRVWKNKAMNLLNKTQFIQSFHKNNIIAAMKNVRSDWVFLRKSGFGATYKKWIIDPMFDSELFTIFNLYIRFKKENSSKLVDINKFFNKLFDVLKNKKKSRNVFINQVINWLPCDVFVCEEHLKNWVVKRAYAESLLLDQKYRTKKYFITGMGLLDGKRMSASKGHAVLAKDLINSYGSVKARLIILLTGGHPSKIYHYDKTLPNQADKLLKKFINYITYLISIKNADKKLYKNNECSSLPAPINNKIEKLIKEGYYRQAILELFSIIPRKYRSPNGSLANQLLSVYRKYVGMLLPSLMNNFNYHETQ